MIKHLILVIFLFASFNVYAQDTATVGKKSSSPIVYNLTEVRKMISYPESALDDELEGKVIVRILVNEDGVAIKDSLISGHKIFYNEVRKWIYKLKMKPATLNDVPIKCYINIPFQFTIPKEDN